ncbi:hypothetical protein BASA60_006733 [Batrachochytrium salamandrivorans]|nr:hypothetical protein BASA60_006733 [Batrachochytrium salamandrivorans]
MEGASAFTREGLSTSFVPTMPPVCLFLMCLEWKLENSKRCPNCSVLINRDEGCNKVDCLYCGHKFCWQCLGQFEKGRCAYYRCQLVGVNNDTTSLKLLDDKPEMGVPNIISIQAKWQRGSAMIET